MFWGVRRAARTVPARSSTLEPLASAIDHVVWSVADLDQAIEQFVERMGFPLLYGPSKTEAAMRVADIGLGSAWIRLVEYPGWPGSQPISLALRSSMPLDDVEICARQRGFESGGVFVSAGRDDSRLPLISFVMLRGVVGPAASGILLVKYFHKIQAQRVGECMRFFDSPAAAYGVLGLTSVRAEVSVEEGVDRWTRLLGHEPGSCRNCWKLPDGGVVEVVLGSVDRISSLVLQAANTRVLQGAWRDTGIASELCDETLIVEPSSAAGLRLQIRPRN